MRCCWAAPAPGALGWHRTAAGGGWGCRPGLESCVGSGGQSAHRWAAPPALLGPEGARAGVKALGFLGHLRAGGPTSEPRGRSAWGAPGPLECQREGLALGTPSQHSPWAGVGDEHAHEAPVPVNSGDLSGAPRPPSPPQPPLARPDPLLSAMSTGRARGRSLGCDGPSHGQPRLPAPSPQPPALLPQSGEGPPWIRGRRRRGQQGLPWLGGAGGWGGRPWG